MSFIKIFLLATLWLASLFSYAGEMGKASASFFRSFDPMTASHNVKLKIDKKQVTKLFHNEAFNIMLPSGKHTFQTSVGFSLGVPNVTGFNGARKFKKKFVLAEGEHFFKVDFKPALLGGKHEIIPVTKEEYNLLLGIDEYENTGKDDVSADLKSPEGAAEHHVLTNSKLTEVESQ